MKIKELAQAERCRESDFLVIGTGAETLRLSAGEALQFLKDTFLSGGVPYGRELTESWADLRSRVQSGDFSGIHIGDYKTVTLTTNEVVVCEVAGIDQYYRCASPEIGHHVDFISRDCLSNSPSGKFNPATEEALVELCADLCGRYQLDPAKDLIRHYDVTGKVCPKWYVDHPEAWEAFKGRVAKKLAPERETLYRVQVGAFSRKENAAEMLEKLKEAGFDGYVKEA